MVILSLPLGPTGAPWGVSLGLTLKTLTYASIDGKEYFFRQSDFVAIHASPRVLVVRVTARCLQCTVVVAHAPHSGVDAAARDLWWDDLSRRLPGQPDVVLLVDANARLGSSVSESVGGGGLCQQEDLT